MEVGGRIRCRVSREVEGEKLVKLASRCSDKVEEQNDVGCKSGRVNGEEAIENLARNGGSLVVNERHISNVSKLIGQSKHSPLYCPVTF